MVVLVMDDSSWGGHAPTATEDHPSEHRSLPASFPGVRHPVGDDCAPGRATDHDATPCRRDSSSVRCRHAQRPLATQRNFGKSVASGGSAGLGRSTDYGSILASRDNVRFIEFGRDNVWLELATGSRAQPTSAHLAGIVASYQIRAASEGGLELREDPLQRDAARSGLLVTSYNDSVTR